MKKVPQSLLWVVSLIVYVLAFGAVFGIRGCAVWSSSPSAIKAAEKSNADREQDRKRYELYRAAAGPAKDGEAPVTGFLRLAKPLLTAPASDDKEKEKMRSYAGIMAAAAPFKDLPKGVVVTSPDPRIAILQALAAHPVFPAMTAWNADEQARIEQLVRGEKKPEDLLPAIEPVPPPAAWWVWWQWGLAWLCGAAVSVAFCALVTWDADDAWYLKVYPWNRVGGIAHAIVVAPAMVLLLIGNGIYLAFRTEWTGKARAAKERLFRFGLRTGLIRKLPTPPPPEGLAPTVAVARTVVVPTPEPAAPEPEVKDEGIDWYLCDPSIVIGFAGELRSRGIETFKISVREPRAYTGMAVHVSQIEAFEEALGLDGVEADLEETDIARTSICSYRLPKQEVQTPGFDRDGSRDRLARILGSLASKIGAGISAEWCDGKERAARERPAAASIRVAYAGFPAGTPGTPDTPPRCFGQAQKKGNIITFFRTDPGLGPVIADADGNAAAQIVRGEIYLLFRGMLSHPDRAWAEEALAATLREAVRAMRETRTEDADTEDADRWKRERDVQRERYVQASLRRIEDRRASVRDLIKDAEKAVVDAGERIARSLTEKAQALIELKSIDALQDSETEQVRKEFDQLHGCKYVTGVEVQQESVDVFTRTVRIRHEGKTYRIGRFRLRLNLDGRIQLHNLDRHIAPGTGFHHPHVPDNEKPCFGNLQESLAKLMAGREYATVVYILFRFLESYNYHSGVERIDAWPEEKDEG